ncbi:ribose 5-phosphate isomerase B [candidate division WOR-3 bacterium]|nr:ribose 5-phosphate isomerase B [candidate division WOR-3 bacterium]
MTIAIGADHRGYKLKSTLVDWLKENHEVKDLGADSRESCDYSDYAIQVAETVSSGKAQLGILICGTGIGMSMAANKVKGIRAARVCTVKDAEMSHRHNNANLLCFGADTGVDAELAEKMITVWLENEFEGGRHERRLGKISDYEDRE